MNIIKNRTVLISLFIVILTSCGSNAPSEQDMKDRQIAYEKKKIEINASLGKFYFSKKEEIFRKLDQFNFALDTVNHSGDVNSDTNFVYENIISEIRLNKNVPKSNLTNTNEGYFTITKTDGEFEHVPEIIESLKVCKETGNDKPCLSLSDHSIKSLLKVDLVFVRDLVLDIEPKIERKNGQNSFETGFRVGRTTCFNINKKTPVFRFITSATNSENVSIRKGLEGFQLKADLGKNFNSAFNLSLHKHFNISN